ncbi:MAG: hypothetical protein WBA93_28505 [Microcoleaceae cyanobacterium]
MGEVPLNLKKWDDTLIPDKLANIENKLGAIEFQLHLIYELGKPPITEGTEEMPAPLQIGLEIPTGANFEFPASFYSGQGETWLRDRLDSDLGINGHKVFSFKSFDLSTSSTDGYDFTVEIDPTFTTVDTTSAPYIQCYLLNPVKVAKLALQFFAGWSNDFLGYFPEDLLGWVKKGNWVAQLSTAPGEIKLKPNFLSWAGFFSVKVQNVGWKSAVISYEQANNKFTILGY